MVLRDKSIIPIRITTLRPKQKHSSTWSSSKTENVQLRLDLYLKKQYLLEILVINERDSSITLKMNTTKSYKIICALRDPDQDGEVGTS